MTRPRPPLQATSHSSGHVRTVRQVHRSRNPSPRPPRRAREPARQFGLALDRLRIVGRRLCRVDLVTVPVFQLVAMRHHPQIDVGVGAVRKPFGDALLAQNPDDREVDVVVPTEDGFSCARFVVAMRVEPLLLEQDVVPDLVVPAERGRADVMIGPQTDRDRSGGETRRTRPAAATRPATSRRRAAPGCGPRSPRHR